jgi:ferredoxin-NADP reductase
MTAIERAVAAPAPKRLQWMTATVREVIEETSRVRSLVIDVPGWSGHRAGQHVDVRLTGEDGYQAQRSYSIASAPETPDLVITVERIIEGEVSPYLAGEVRPGDRFELRGPIGGYFVWTVPLDGHLFLVAGGSGIAPLMAMLRHRAAANSDTPATLLYSSRTAEDIIYRAELEHLDRQVGTKVVHTLTRMQPAGWSGFSRRIDRAMLEATCFPVVVRPRIFVCGPTPLVEVAARALRDIGHSQNLIKTERFGPTGGSYG